MSLQGIIYIKMVPDTAELAQCSEIIVHMIYNLFIVDISGEDHFDFENNSYTGEKEKSIGGIIFIQNEKERDKKKQQKGGQLILPNSNREISLEDGTPSLSRFRWEAQSQFDCQLNQLCRLPFCSKTFSINGYLCIYLQSILKLKHSHFTFACS